MVEIGVEVKFSVSDPEVARNGTRGRPTIKIKCNFKVTIRPLYPREISPEYEEAERKTAHVLAGFTFIEQLTGQATEPALLSNTERPL